MPRLEWQELLPVPWQSRLHWHGNALQRRKISRLAVRAQGEVSAELAQVLKALTANR